MAKRRKKPDTEDVKDDYMPMRVSAADKRAFLAAARRDNRTLTGWAINILKKAAAKDR